MLIFLEVINLKGHLNRITSSGILGFWWMGGFCLLVEIPRWRALLPRKLISSQGRYCPKSSFLNIWVFVSRRGGTSRWRVCYQWGLPCLIFLTSSLFIFCILAWLASCTIWTNCCSWYTGFKASGSKDSVVFVLFPMRLLPLLSWMDQPTRKPVIVLSSQESSSSVLTL